MIYVLFRTLGKAYWDQSAQNLAIWRGSYFSGMGGLDDSNREKHQLVLFWPWPLHFLEANEFKLHYGHSDCLINLQEEFVQLKIRALRPVADFEEL